MAARSTTFPAIVLSIVVLMVSSPVRAGGGDVGPDGAEIRQAQKLAAALRGAGGIERAMRILCREELSGPRFHAARGVLIERAAAAMPTLLDTVELDVVPNTEGARRCSAPPPRPC